MEYEVATELGFGKVNNKVNMDPIDLKVGQILVRLLIPVLQDPLPVLNLLIEGDLFSDTLF